MNRVAECMKAIRCPCLTFKSRNKHLYMEKQLNIAFDLTLAKITAIIIVIRIGHSVVEFLHEIIV